MTIHVRAKKDAAKHAKEAADDASRRASEQFRSRYWISPMFFNNISLLFFLPKKKNNWILVVRWWVCEMFLNNKLLALIVKCWQTFWPLHLKINLIARQSKVCCIYRIGLYFFFQFFQFFRTFQKWFDFSNILCGSIGFKSNGSSSTANFSIAANQFQELTKQFVRAQANAEKDAPLRAPRGVARRALFAISQFAKLDGEVTVVLLLTSLVIQYKRNSKSFCLKFLCFFLSTK